MKLIYNTIILAVFTLTVSCSQINVTKTGSGIYPPTSQASVEIRATEPKDRKFTEIGMVSGDIYGPPANGYNLIRQKSSAVGADAVILQNQFTMGARTMINGVAIKYR